MPHALTEPSRMMLLACHNLMHSSFFHSRYATRMAVLLRTHAVVAFNGAEVYLEHIADVKRLLRLVVAVPGKQASVWVEVQYSVHMSTKLPPPAFSAGMNLNDAFQQHQSHHFHQTRQTSWYSGSSQLPMLEDSQEDLQGKAATAANQDKCSNAIKIEAQQRHKEQCIFLVTWEDACQPFEDHLIA